jgi:hypothetical protein
MDAIAVHSTPDVPRRTLDAGQSSANIRCSPVGHVPLAVAPGCCWPSALHDVIFS